MLNPLLRTGGFNYGQGVEKVKLRSKIVILLFAFLLIILGVTTLALVFGWSDPIEYLVETLNTEEGRWLVGLAGGVLILLGLVLIPSSLGSKTASEGVVQELQMGRVVTTIPALEGVVHRAVRQVRGVKEVKPVIRINTEGVTVLLRVVLSPEIKVTDIAREIQENVKEQISETVGIQVLEIQIKVDKIGYNGPARVE